MPEGPEVECTKRLLKPVIGKKIREIMLTELSQKYKKYRNKQNIFNEFSGFKVKEIRRKGKFLIWIFDYEKIILNHLGMSGKWIFVDDTKQEFPTHSKIIILFEDLQKSLIFDDVRNFGQFRIFESYDSVSNYPPIRRMGIDGLALPFPIEDFLQKIDKSNYSNKEIGSVLLDQKLVAGVGNIYKAESLYEARINPTKHVKDITKKEREKLGIAISKILHKALSSQGSTFNIQPFQTPNGEEGTAQKWHKVYGKKDTPCQDCGTKISNIKQNSRSTFFCPKCQI